VGMSSIPEFFLPHMSPEGQEAAFAYMADGLRRPVPAISERVYSISFESDGTLWVATVGERLRGRKPRLKNGKTIGWEEWFNDPTLILAIFPPVPYIVVAQPGTNAHFRDQAFAATPIGITPFSHSSKYRLARRKDQQK
jgi:hypothetical protein